MKAVGQEVQVSLAPNGSPQHLTWAGRVYPVGTVLDEWRYGGRWWLGEPPRTCYRLQAGALTVEVHREDGPSPRWWLARVQD